MKYSIHKTKKSGLYVADKSNNIENLKSTEDVNKWVKGLSGKDEVRTLLAGSGDGLLLRIQERGAKIFTFPTIHLNGHTKTEEITQAIIDASPEKLLAFTPTDAKMVELGIAVNLYQSVQRTMRIPAQQRLSALVEDLDLLVGHPPLRKKKEAKTTWAAMFEERLKSFRAYEDQIAKAVFKPLLKEIPIWTEYLKAVRGIDTILAAQLVAPIKTGRRFPTKRGFRKYCGRAPNNGWLMRRKRGEKQGYHSGLKVVTYKIGESFIKARNPKFRGIYDERRLIEEKEHDGKCGIWSHADSKKAGTGKRSLGTQVCSRKGHMYARARHWMICRFLDELWQTWRKLDGCAE